MIASTRRGVLIGTCATAATFTAKSSVAQLIPPFGPPPHTKGPPVFLDYDQVELDAAYDQTVYEPNYSQIGARFASNSEGTRARIGQPIRLAYGPTDIEKLDIYKTRQANVPILVLIPGGEWRFGSAKSTAFPAEVFVNAGAHYVLPDYQLVQDAGGSLMPMADQVRRAIAWVHRNAAEFGGNQDRIYVAGFSAGAHLAAVALTTDWKKDFDLPADTTKGGICISGIYDLEPVRRSFRRSYIKFDDEMEESLSPQRHLDKLATPLVVAYGTLETPEFQRQGRDFAAAVKATGKPVQLVVGQNYAHMEMMESLANPYGLMGRTALQHMRLIGATERCR
jgi:arylformamidase